MKLLLDTHAFYWFVAGDARMPMHVRSAIEDDGSDVFVSIASLWEMAIKVGNGKWPEAAPVVSSFAEELTANDFEPLPILIAHARAAGLMVSSHRDPFDRLLAAQAAIEGLALVTADPKLASLGAPLLW